MPAQVQDPMTARDERLASLDRQRDEALKNLGQFETAEGDAVAKGDPGAILAAVRLGIEAIRAHLSDLSDQRDRWVA